MKQHQNPILMTITTYSLLVVAVITLLFVFFTGINVETNSLNGHETALFSKITGLLFLLLFTTIIIVDLIFILKHKSWAYIMIFPLGLILLIVLLMQKPFDWLSLTTLILILTVFVLFRPKKPPKKDQSAPSNELLEKNLNHNE